MVLSPAVHQKHLNAFFNKIKKPGPHSYRFQCSRSGGGVGWGGARLLNISKDLQVILICFDSS